MLRGSTSRTICILSSLSLCHLVPFSLGPARSMWYRKAVYFMTDRKQEQGERKGLWSKHAPKCRPPALPQVTYFLGPASSDLLPRPHPLKCPQVPNSPLNTDSVNLFMKLSPHNLIISQMPPHPHSAPALEIKTLTHKSFWRTFLDLNCNTQEICVF